MESGGYKMVQIKREKDDIFDEVFERSGVKYKPFHSGDYDVSYIEDVGFSDASTIQCKAEQEINSDFHCTDHQNGDVKIEIVEHVPGKCELYDSSGMDNVHQRIEYFKCEEQKEETYVAVKRNIEDVDFTDASTIQCEAGQVNNEFRCDNQYGDDKFEFVENGLGNLKRSYTGQRPFLCKICSKAFSRSDEMKAHERIHTGVKPFICMICSKVFAHLSNLKVHERMHTGVKPFICKICSKAFTRSDELKVHGRIHTGEKPFFCKICSKAFTQSSNLKAHERIHTREKPFCCDICSKAFNFSSNLKRHKRIHTGQK